MNKFTMNNIQLELNSRPQIRQHIRQRRRQLSIAQQQDSAKKLCLQLCQHPRIAKARHIAVYLANDGEISLSPFIQWCWQQQKQVYLPVLHPFTQGNLLFLHYQQNTLLQPNSYQIPEPALDVRKVIPTNQLDVMITPLVAFDVKGNRLGMGGGFYDRTLASWFRESKDKASADTEALYPVGVAHECQQVPVLPIDSWDVPLAEIITPKKTFQNQALNCSMSSS
ncbi:5-formyltetrahydrofolate cyclo-ligase [Thalassotalea aquiviva]|uniref:5-formyltetrahydrofolate cyclo-ligase n=1 Tax=Thalassotalea aquiviva TaxID=3242415 RepID=UPI00352A1402